MEYYVLLLTNGDFVSYDQVGNDEVDVIPCIFKDTVTFPTLDEARLASKGINTGIDGEFKIYSKYKVESILKAYSLE